MKFDRNTVIGFVLLALLFFGFFYFNTQEQARSAKNKAIKDSIDNVAKAKTKVDTSGQKRDTSNFNTPQITSVTGQFQKQMIGSEQLASVENDLVKIAFTNKGGQVKSVELKKFKDQQKKLVKLASTGFDKIDYKIKGDPEQVGNITDFYFTGGNVVAKGDSLQIITLHSGR
jgi:YidC/Oxa1 family membrane protein insertase